MRPPKIVYLVLLGIVFLGIGFLLGKSSPRPVSEFVQPSSGVNPPPTGVALPESTNGGRREKAKVLRVIDGDTIEVQLDPTTGSGRADLKVRYIGIDTPETVDPRKPVQCFGQEATAKNKELVEGKEVELEKDVSETDKFGRLLRYVYVVDTVSQPQNEPGSSARTSARIFVNEELVRQGYAYASTFPPDVKYQEVLRQAQDEARENKRGLWAACPVEGSSSVLPTLASPSQTLQGGCVIKGNISSSGKIYHLPGCGSYDKTVINKSQGERWFCSEEEAEASGWRKAKNC